MKKGMFDSELLPAGTSNVGEGEVKVFHEVLPNVDIVRVGSRFTMVADDENFLGVLREDMVVFTNHRTGQWRSFPLVRLS